MSDLYTMIRFLFCYFLAGSNCFILNNFYCLTSRLKSIICPALLTAGVSLGVQIHQYPSALIRKAGDDAQLVCTHGHTDYTVMLWYQKSPGDAALKLIGYVDYNRVNYEEIYKEHVSITGKLSGNTAKNGSLSIQDLKESEHSGVYYCAARDAR